MNEDDLDADTVEELGESDEEEEDEEDEEDEEKESDESVELDLDGEQGGEDEYNILGFAAF
jgi:hypothetical protein